MSHVLLRHKDKIVGTAKYFTAGSMKPSTTLHGLPLTDFARNNEDLVVVYHVQIFNEYTKLPYAYTYGGSETAPKILGDMNEAEKHFKAFIAWDNNEILPHLSGHDLGDQPQVVSEKTLSIADENLSAGKRTSSRHVRSLLTIDDDNVNLSRSAESNLGSIDDDEGGHFTTVAVEQREYRPFSRNRYQGRKRQSFGSILQLDLSTDESGENGLNTHSNANGDEQESMLGSFVDEDDTGSCSEDVDIASAGYESILVDRDSASSGALDQASTEIGNEAHSDNSGDPDSDASVQAEDCSKVLPVLRKRPYVYHSRKRGIATGPRDLRKRRKILSQRIDNPFLRSGLHCCKSLKCFETVDPILAFKTYKQVMAMNREDFKSFLIGLFHPEESCFFFGGEKVCARFLQSGLGFSNDLQCSVKSTPCAPAGPTAAALPRLRLSNKKDAIINFLHDYANECGDMMPNALFTNLPDVARLQVYAKLKENFGKHFPNQVPPSLNFFYSVWKSQCRTIRTRRNHGFARCEVCIFLKNEIAENQRRLSVVRKARETLEEHLEMVREERRLYRHRSERATKHPRSYISVVVDGADQKAYGLPHFLDMSKSDKGHKIKVKCVGSLHHGSTNRLGLFVMTDELLTGANHIIEVVHRTLTDQKNERGRLPKVLYVQVDNCTRENKNRYLMAYFEMIIAFGVFEEVEVSFLPIGHTHIDIDQSFSAVSSVLKRSNAATLDEMMTMMGISYNSRTFVERLDRIVNFSGLCNESKCLVRASSLHGFTQNRYFRFTRAVGNAAQENTFRTQCHVKVQAKDMWEPMSLGAIKGFLISVPDLHRTPDTETFPPDNVTEVNKCLNSLHGRTRINANRIISALEPLRDEIYTKRFDSMHWDVEECFEMNGDFAADDENNEETGLLSEEENDSDGGDQSVENANEYEVDSFIAVKTDASTKSSFWIATVLEVLDRSTSNRSRWLRVLWYSQKSGAEDEFAARYVPSQVFDSKRHRHVPYEDQVEVETVLLQFDSLNSQGYLRVSTRTALRQVLGRN